MIKRFTLRYFDIDTKDKIKLTFGNNKTVLQPTGWYRAIIVYRRAFENPY